MKDAFEIVLAAILSVGGSAVIIFGLSSFLGKVWAQRILESEIAKHQKDVTEFKSQLQSIAEQKSLNYSQKIDLYKVVSSPLVELVALLNKQNGLEVSHVHEFDRQRLHISAQLALFAPQNVFDSFNDMVDYIYDSLEQGNYDFGVFRVKALEFMSEMRKDIGIYSDSIKYNGHR